MEWENARIILQRARTYAILEKTPSAADKEDVPWNKEKRI
jgi:hypothetical protein